VERKFRDLKIESFQDDLTEARRRLRHARMPDPLAGFFCCRRGCWFSVNRLGIWRAMWGTATAVFALTTTLYALPWQEAYRARNVEGVTEEIAALERDIDEIEPDVFSLPEEVTVAIAEQRKSSTLVGNIWQSQTVASGRPANSFDHCVTPVTDHTFGRCQASVYVRECPRDANPIFDVRNARDYRFCPRFSCGLYCNERSQFPMK